MTATSLPVRVMGSLGTIQPSSKALSMIAHSMFLMVTGFSIKRSSACFQRPRYTNSFHSGILLPSGQPVSFWWQKGTPQSMQRAP